MMNEQSIAKIVRCFIGMTEAIQEATRGIHKVVSAESAVKSQPDMTPSIHQTEPNETQEQQDVALEEPVSCGKSVQELAFELERAKEFFEGYRKASMVRQETLTTDIEEHRKTIRDLRSELEMARAERESRRPRYNVYTSGAYPVAGARWSVVVARDADHARELLRNARARARCADTDEQARSYDLQYLNTSIPGVVPA